MDAFTHVSDVFHLLPIEPECTLPFNGAVSEFRRIFHGVLWVLCSEYPYSGDKICIKPPVEADYYLNSKKCSVNPH